ncbi:hypothetical protein [Amycolatopsis sp. NBC_01480]|uniref:hypothetical protein n=1 Tax=Amycolatopsis sp. NBC_01480 TaxID=2903562 RepID=UPI002E28930A|nr:hypothetical protein [Amycolatopsis sp. NBC_01480]
MTEAFDLPAALTELLYGNENDEPLEKTLDRLVTPGFVQRINGRVYDRDQYIPHVREMRRMVTGGGELQVLEQSATATGFAGRYLFTMVQDGGQAATFESHLFARIEDGKIDRMIEVARQAEDGDGDLFASA